MGSSRDVVVVEIGVRFSVHVIIEVLPETPVELAEPLPVDDEGADNAAHLVLVVTAAQAVEEAKLFDPLDVTVDLAAELDVVSVGRRVDANQIKYLVAAQDEAYLGAGGVEFEEVLAQECDEQAGGERKGVPRDEARIFDLALALTEAAELGITVGLVDFEAQAKDGDVVSDPPPMTG